MAKDIADVLGIVEDTDFPTGYKIVDGQTFVSAELYQDMIQTFQKMLELASITPNGNFDNETNGYQMLDALKKYIKDSMFLYSGGLRKNVYSINKWDMLNETTVLFNHGLTLAQTQSIRRMDCVIYKDPDSEGFRSPFTIHATSTGEGATMGLTPTQIIIQTLTGSFFRNFNFSRLDVVRGFVVLEFLDV